MKIEKINDNQIKFILSNTDLLDRDIKLNELAYGSEKTQELFHEMMEQAMVECGFQTDNVPLMIEAIPVATDSITILVTKVTSMGSIEEQFNNISGFSFLNNDQTKERVGKEVKERVQNKKNKEKILIFSFDTLDQVTAAAQRLYGEFIGVNQLYKYQQKYFLLMTCDHVSGALSYEDLDAILSEFGSKHISNTIAKYHLKEHGEILISREALNLMATYL